MIGIALVLLSLYDVFETVVVPRRTGRWLRMAPSVIGWLWPLWRRYGTRIRVDWRREDFLGTFAPAATLLLLVIWVVLLIVGFGLILHGLADQIDPPLDSYQGAFYLAGTSLLTVGFGDYVPKAAAARFAVLFAAASGLAVVALVIALIFNLYSSFARREVLVLLLDARAGVPPSGVMLLETFGRAGIIDQLAGTFTEFEKWTAEVLDSHLAYPILPYFRSSHDGQSWVSTLGAVLDAATLLSTTTRADSARATAGMGRSLASAEMMYATGCHALIDLTHWPRFKRALRGRGQSPGIEQAEFRTACRQLIEVGYDIDYDDDAWRRFAERRAVYAERLNLLARYFSIPPSLWIGDRSMLMRHAHEAHLES